MLRTSPKSTSKHKPTTIKLSHPTSRRSKFIKKPSKLYSISSHSITTQSTPITTQTTQTKSTSSVSSPHHHNQSISSSPSQSISITPTTPIHTQSQRTKFSFSNPTSFANVPPPPKMSWEKHTDKVDKMTFKSQNQLSTKQVIPDDLRPVSPLDPEYESHYFPKQNKFSFTGQLSTPNSPPPTLHRSTFGGQLTNVLTTAQENYNKSDVTGVALNDLETMFKNSKLAGLFSQQQIGPTFWAHLDVPKLYFVGTRQLFNSSGDGLPATFCFAERNINKQQRTIRDNYTTYSFDTNGTDESSILYTLEPDLIRGTAIPIPNNIGVGLSSQTVCRFRGVGWKWHSLVQMTQITPDPTYQWEQHHPGQQDPRGESYFMTRVKFTENGFVSEKLLRQNNKITMTIIDHMNIVDEAFYHKKLNEAKAMEM